MHALRLPGLRGLCRGHPPGGDEGIARLAALTGRPALPLNPTNGIEAPRQLAVIDEAWCIGCTLCLKACPVDAIVGGPKSMHTVIDADCTGCELCLPVCPVDCIALVAASGDATGWAAWSSEQADRARDRYAFHQFRLARDAQERDDRLAAKALASATASPPPGPADAGPDPSPDAKRLAIEAAIARARAARESAA